MVNRMVVRGFHGTHIEAVESILESGFTSSSSPTEWLGQGVYFFQDAPGLAAEWARERHGAKAVVMEAEIDLGRCLDRLDIVHAGFLREVHDVILEQHKAANLRLPTQDPGKKLHKLDCAVINMACGLMGQIGQPFDSVRSAFREGDPLYGRSAFHSQDHVQICVRNPELITNIAVYEEAP